MTLGQKIKSLRKKADLTLRDLAKKVDNDFTYLSKIENDKTDGRLPSAEMLKRLAKVLNADEEELLALAGRISEETKKIITSDQNALRFFRTIKDSNRDQQFWDELNSLVERQLKKKK